MRNPKEELREYHKALEENQRNVGNYESALDNAIKKLTNNDMNWRKFSSFLLGLIFICLVIAIIIQVKKEVKPTPPNQHTTHRPIPTL
jgi:t-SNARE complex subunit (syntaxin)